MEKARKTLTVSDEIVDRSSPNYRELKKEVELEGPKKYDALSAEAKRGLEDFGLSLIHI